MSTRHPRSSILWIATLAILMSALAPSVTSLLANLRGEILLDICTAPYSDGASQAVQLLQQQVSPGHPAPNRPALHDGSHCPYCQLQQQLPAMPSPPAPLVLTDQGTLLRVLLLAPTPPPAPHAWSAHPSRAPPIRS